jgi:hypothetical protein
LDTEDDDDDDDDDDNDGDDGGATVGEFKVGRIGDRSVDCNCVQCADDRHEMTVSESK